MHVLVHSLEKWLPLLACRVGCLPLASRVLAAHSGPPTCCLQTPDAAYCFVSDVFLLMISLVRVRFFFVTVSVQHCV